MKKYTISKDAPLTSAVMGKILNDFQLTQLPLLKKRYDYYLGKQKITFKIASDTGKPCNRIVSNFCRNIVDTYEGYSVGIPVTYTSQNKGFEQLQDIFNYNDVDDEDSELVRDALIFGRAVEICYVDEDAKQRFITLSPMTIVPVYSNTLDNTLLYVIRFWQEELVTNSDPIYTVEVYNDKDVTIFSSYEGFNSFILKGKRPHFYNQVPITIFELNDEEEGIADQVFSLQDAYNSLLSDSVDDFDSFCDAYMVIKGMTADDEDIKAMKEHRVLLMDSDASAEYLVKDTSTQEIQNLLTTCESKIREMSACPNFANETFASSSGIAIRYRMMAMENRVAGIMNNFKKALQRRVELLADVIKLVNGEELWRDIEITFHRNIPMDMSAVASEINSLRGLVSDETLLAQIPFITDVEEELLKKAKEEEKKMNVYTGESFILEDGQEDTTEA